MVTLFPSWNNLVSTLKSSASFGPRLSLSVLPQWLRGRVCLKCRRCRRHGFDLWVGRSPGGGHGNPLQYSCWKNQMGRGAWWVPVHGITKSQTGLKWLSTRACTPSLWGTNLSLIPFLVLGFLGFLGWACLACGFHKHHSSDGNKSTIFSDAWSDL